MIADCELTSALTVTGVVPVLGYGDLFDSSVWCVVVVADCVSVCGAYSVTVDDCEEDLSSSDESCCVSVLNDSIAVP